MTARTARCAVIRRVTVTDLPGIYSLSPYTSEEVVSRRFILEDDPDAIIDIVDATNIERNLYLTLQLMELDRPMVLALNMMDELTGGGGTVSVNRLEAALGIPVVPISAAREEGISELVEHVLHVARFREHPGRVDFCAPDGADGGRAPPLHPWHLPHHRGPCRGGEPPGALCRDQAHRGRPSCPARARPGTERARTP